MLEHNKRILELLNSYVSIEQAPRYAIMINGEWGAGKTFFIKEKWLKQLDDNSKYDIKFISLFGISSTDELLSKIPFSSLNYTDDTDDKYSQLKSGIEKLSDSKAVSKGLGLVKLLADKKLGVDTNSLFRIFTDSWLSEDVEDKTKIIIFDDFERSGLELKEILGFVSSNLEATKLRVIFISNDKRNIVTNKKTDYKDFKEKVIGETLKIEADYDTAILTFIDEFEFKVDCSTISKIVKEIVLKLKCFCLLDLSLPSS